MTRVPAILGMLFLAACGKPSDQKTATIPAHGHKLADLVIAADAPIFDTVGADYAETVWIDGVWKIHDGGAWIADGPDEDAIYQIMKGIRDKRPDSRVLISAEKNTAFREIVMVVRGAARAGLTSINFLVSTGSPEPDIHAFVVDLPKADTNETYPFFISLDERGAVHSGLGASRIMMDPDTADHTLPGLNSQLELYAAAAKAAEIRPVSMVHADPAANYQRVIDLLSSFHEHGVFIRFTDFRIE